MQTTVFDGITWDIGEMPIGSSTPDEFFELSYRATAQCPECGSQLTGVAQIWSRDENMVGCWVDRVDYEPCGCADGTDEWDDFDLDDEELDDE